MKFELQRTFERIERLHEARFVKDADKLGSGPTGCPEQNAAPPAPSKLPRMRVGTISRAIEKVLAKATSPMRVAEIHQQAEVLLNRPVSRSTIKSRLWADAQKPVPKYQRIRRGVYRLA
jgi:hypothetical protein